ncbi:MAG: DMT family transporter, partial [Pseudorhodobacter sp.]|nr:DMT family transporter [Rhizobacter sp.]
MGPRDIAELVSLAMLWGGSFLFMRMGAAEFGPVPLSALRLIGASLLLMPLLLWRGQGQALRQHWRPIFFVGVTNSALPFVCFAFAALSVTAGLMAIFNAATPLFAAVIAWWWLK